MKRHNDIFRLWIIVISMIVVLLVIVTSTYAWFTANKVVSTNRAEARSGTDTLELQISSEGGDAFKAMEAAAIQQVNATSVTKLMPVSTSDLKSFVYNPMTVDGIAASFVPVENEKYYYHGRFYIRAQAQGQPAGAKVKLYLDEDNEVGGTLAKSEAGILLNAARLGMTFDNSNPVIFFLSDKKNNADDQARNTKVDGVILEDDKVLHLESGKVKGVNDTSVALSDMTISMDDSRVLLPKVPLLEMTLNRIYEVDVYLYLEGCDPDCSDSISMNEGDLHLAFYGILE